MASNITVQEAATRLSGAGFANADRYTRGTSGKGSRWAQKTGAAGANYQEGVQRALAEKRFDKGVAAAGPSAYDTGVQQKGAQNWPAGMQLGGDKYARKVAKFAPLWNQELPTPRGSKRSPNNLKRMQENVDRFQKAA